MRDACIEGRADDVKALIDAGYRVQSRSMRGRCTLLLATKHGHMDIAQMLLEAGARVNVQDQEGMTPLMHSIKCGDVTFAASLIKAKADVKCNAFGKTPLSCAAENGDVAVLQMLINAKAPIETWPRNPLKYAAKGGSEHAVQVLLDAKAAPDELGSEGPFHNAIEGGNPQIVKMLLAAKARLPASNNRYPFCNDTLALAARHNKLDVIHVLIEAKARTERPDMHANYSWRDRDRDSPLATAIANGSTDAVKVLIQAKAKMDVPNTSYIHDLMRCAIEASVEHANDGILRAILDANAALMPGRWGKGALRCAVEVGSPSIIKTLVEVNVSPNDVYERKHPYTLLMKAALENNLSIGRALIDAKANVDYRPEYEQTALMIAARDKHPEFVQMLVDNKASLELVDEKGRTALDHAIQSDRGSTEGCFTQVQVISILAAVGASLERKDKHGETHLHEAASRGDLNILKALVDSRADIDARSPEGFTPLMLAALNVSTRILETLLSADPAWFDAETDRGRTALMFAVSNKREDDPNVVRMLLEHAIARYAAESYEEPPVKRFKRVE